MRKLIYRTIYLWCSYIDHCPLPKWMRRKVYKEALSRIKDIDNHCYMCVHIRNSFADLMGSHRIIPGGSLLPEFNRADFCRFLRRKDPSYYDSVHKLGFCSIFRSTWLPIGEKEREWRIKFLEHIISKVS